MYTVLVYIYIYTVYTSGEDPEFFTQDSDLYPDSAQLNKTGSESDLNLK